MPLEQHVPTKVPEDIRGIGVIREFEMFQGWSFATVNSSETVRVMRRQTVNAELASMGDMWSNHEKRFST
jgi:hypothetical protein